MVLMKCFKARQFNGNPITKHNKNPVAIRQSYTLNSVPRIKSTSGVVFGAVEVANIARHTAV